MAHEDLTFPSGDGWCAATLVRPEGAGGPVPCVVMSHGFSLTRHDGLVPYAERLAAAGVAVLIFDPRHLGDSSGFPRGRFRVGLQRADWRAAVAFARGLAGVDAERIVLWGFSFACAHVVDLAAREPDGIAAVVTVAPMVDGLARALASPPTETAWMVPRAVADTLGVHNTVAVTAPPGGRAAMTLPGESEGFAAAVGPGSPWRNRITPGILLSLPFVRPVRLAPRLRMPVWVGLGEHDVSVGRSSVERLAAEAPQGELHRYPYDHFGFFTGAAPDRVAGDQAAFLTRYGLAREARPAVSPAT